MTDRKSVEIQSRWRHLENGPKGPIFTGNLADAIFSKNILKVPLPYGWEPEDVQSKYDTYNTYSLNSYNCRGPEFTSDVDFIFAGCSQTFGIGVPDDGVWPKFVADKLNASYVNLSMLGPGMEWITDSIYRYVNTFGKPKRGIMVFAPDYYRVDVLVDNKLSSCSRHGVSDYLPQYYDESNLDFRLVTCHLDNSYSPSFLKKPYAVDNTMLEEEAIRRNIKAMKDLEIFCEQSGVPLIWSTWDKEGLEELIFSLPDEYKFNYYIPTNDYSWMSTNIGIVPSEKDEEGIADWILDGGRPIYCHADLEDYYGLSFHKGTDRFKFEKRDQSHMGVHRHIHIAEDFAAKAVEMGI